MDRSKYIPNSIFKAVASYSDGDLEKAVLKNYKLQISENIVIAENNLKKIETLVKELERDVIIRNSVILSNMLKNSMKVCEEVRYFMKSCENTNNSLETNKIVSIQLFNTITELRNIIRDLNYFKIIVYLNRPSLEEIEF